MNYALQEKAIVRIHPDANVSPTAMIGTPGRPLLSGTPIKIEDTIIEENVSVGAFSIIGSGSIIERESIIDDLVKIEQNVRVGRRTIITFKAYIAMNCTIGSECVVGGFLTDRTIVGSGSRIFGNIVHKHTNITAGWDDDQAHEPSAKIGDRVFVGFGASVIGSIKIGDDVYIAANAIVTRDVPADHMVTGVNIISKRAK